MVSDIRIFFASVFSTVNQSFFGNTRRISGSIYDFNLLSLDGKPVNLSQFQGKKMLIVNTASKCGFTGQLSDLQKLHEQYSDKIAVLGFPSNDFLWQEPGSNQDIAEFCTVNYGVTFQMFEKISVKGKNAHPLFKWLESASGKAPSWNFCKYLINEKGEVLDFFLPRVKPLDHLIIEKILA
jgi:glutathione peroxidase